MASNTTYNPGNVNDFVKSALNYDAIGISGIATARETTNIDKLISDDVLLTGAQVLTNLANFGDALSFQVIDIDGIIAPAGTVLNQFVTNWQLKSDSQEQINLEVNYPAKVYAGLYLRLVYVSTGSSPVQIAINYSLHKILV